MSDDVSTAAFVEVWPRSESLDKHIFGLAGPQWRMNLYGLYLGTGRFIPKEAKATAGATFGFCDSAGNYVPMNNEKATHLGWTLDSLGAEP